MNYNIAFLILLVDFINFDLLILSVDFVMNAIRDRHYYFIHKVHMFKQILVRGLFFCILGIFHSRASTWNHSRQHQANSSPC